MLSEVTKVRRNLFNQEFSPSKRLAKRGLPRSHSVSAVEGLAQELDNAERPKGACACPKGAGFLDPNQS